MFKLQADPSATKVVILVTPLVQTYVVLFTCLSNILVPLYHFESSLLFFLTPSPKTLTLLFSFLLFILISSLTTLSLFFLYCFIPRFYRVCKTQVLLMISIHLHLFVMTTEVWPTKIFKTFFIRYYEVSDQIKFKQII